MSRHHLIYSLIFMVGIVACHSNNKKSSSAIYDQQLEAAILLIKRYQTDSAEIILKEIITDEVKTTFPSVFIKAELNLGRIESDRGDNVNALQHYQSAMKTAEEIEDKNAIPHILKNIGILYVQWKKFDEALSYYEKAEKQAQLIGDEGLIADCQNNKGIVYEQQNKLDEAVITYNKALDYYVSQNILERIAMVYSNLAIVYKMQKKYGEAINYNLKAISIFEKEQDKWSIAATYNNIGNLYTILGNYAKAIEYGNKSLSIAQEISAEEIIGMANENLAAVSAEANDHKKAYEYLKAYSESMNKFINKESTRQLSELTIKYETEKKEKEIAKNKLASKQKNIWLLLLGGTIIIGLIVFRNYRLKTMHKKQQLALENQLLIEQTNTKIQQQRLEISRDLHDSLGTQLTFIHFTLEGLKDISTKMNGSTTSKINTLSHFSKNAITELKNTLWALNSNEVTLESFKAKVASFIKNASEAKEGLRFIFDFEIQENYRLQSKQAINIFRVIQEIINNAVKYANASEINISIQQKEKKIALLIADNGIGFDYEVAKHKSYGLQNIKKRIEDINGILQLKTAINQGTSYSIEITL